MKLLDEAALRPHFEVIGRHAGYFGPKSFDNVAGLPSSLEDDDITAKQFDLLILKAQLALLQADKSFEAHRKRIRELASLLEELRNVPMVAAEMELLLDIQTDEFWQDITAAMLSNGLQH